MNTYVRIALFAMVAVTVVFPGTPQATFYKWQDAEGNVHFTDDLTTVPPPYRERVKVQELPESTANVTPVSVKPQDTPAQEQPGSEDPYSECQQRVQKEKERWTRQLEEDQDRLVELNRVIHRSTESRKKNAYQRERVTLKERIAKAEEVLRDTVPPMEQECEAIRYWQSEE